MRVEGWGVEGWGWGWRVGNGEGYIHVLPHARANKNTHAHITHTLHIYTHIAVYQISNIWSFLCS